VQQPEGWVPKRKQEAGCGNVDAINAAATWCGNWALLMHSHAACLPGRPLGQDRRSAT
jgi:hypothetical protein